MIPLRATLHLTTLAVAAALALFPAQAQVGPAPIAGSAAQAQAAAEQRILGLQQQLRITDAQLPQWNAFAAAMRENAQSTDGLVRQRAATVQSMTALDNINSYAEIARAYADSTAKLATAFNALYVALAAEQRQIADGVFRQQAGQQAAPAPRRR